MGSTSRNGESSNVWDEIYSGEGYGFKPEPELVAFLKEVRPGKALDVGAGEGRNALWLAAQGWSVEAADVSGAGISNLVNLASERGLDIKCTVGSAADLDYGSSRRDLVVSVGFVLNFFKKEESKEILERMKGAVRRGGRIYISVSTVDDPAYQRHRVKADCVVDDSFFIEKAGIWVTGFQPGELRECFGGYEVVLYEEKDVLDDSHGEPHTHRVAFLGAVRN